MDGRSFKGVRLYYAERQSGPQKNDYNEYNVFFSFEIRT